ncbi:MAG: 16S rRNA (cytidine(1402)-2'-O)-methyltransferase [Deltaproteobacteria bacterium]|nr:16S rRNA (cytidine(1402)-2'-O)-methyltransferase [Deltaproteobacteria bacterium]
MSGSFFVVATPIGNLQDFSPRAQDALRGASLILCEDTRHSSPLLARIGANGKTLSCHQHNEEQRVNVVVERIQDGDDVALISDAGAPGLSDPGGRLIDLLVQEGIQVEVVPGPTALGASLMGAGLNTTRFAFLGFLPKRSKARREIVSAALSAGFAAIIYEAPTRIKATLAELATFAGEKRRVVVARELTKKFETFHRGTLAGPLLPELMEKGEMVIVVEGGDEELEEQAKIPAAEWALKASQDLSLSPKERTKQVMENANCSRKEAYALLLALKDAEGENTAFHRNSKKVSSESSLTKASLVDHLRNAVHSFLSVEGSSLDDGEQSVEEQLCAYLSSTQPHSLPAPTEAKKLARALLTTCAAAEALEDALEMVQETRPPNPKF